MVEIHVDKTISLFELMVIHKFCRYCGHIKCYPPYECSGYKPMNNKAVNLTNLIDGKYFQSWKKRLPKTEVIK